MLVGALSCREREVTTSELLSKVEAVPKRSLALANLRGFAILMVLFFHSFIAYVISQPASALPFDDPPYGWLVNPIIDSERWLGFDLFCAFQYTYLMHLMFFLSGMFVWPSLVGKRPQGFLRGRFVRLGRCRRRGTGVYFRGWHRRQHAHP